MKHTKKEKKAKRLMNPQWDLVSMLNNLKKVVEVERMRQRYHIPQLGNFKLCPRDLRWLEMLRQHEHNNSCYTFKNQDLLSMNSKGISNHLTWILCKYILRLVNFYGVFSEDKTPSLAELKRDAACTQGFHSGAFSVIINLAPAAIPAGHFVAIIKIPAMQENGRGTILYVDSFAQPPHTPSVMRLLDSCVQDNHDVLVWKKAVQPRDSAMCSFYAISCICQFDDKFRNDQKCLSKLIPFSSRKRDNDIVIANNIIVFIRCSHNESIV